MMRTIGQAIREKRRAKGWSQAELARRSSLSSSTIYRLERGLRQPRSTTLCALFTAFGPVALKVWQDNPKFYEAPGRGLTWADRDAPVPSWMAWVSTPWEKKEES